MRASWPPVNDDDADGNLLPRLIYNSDSTAAAAAAVRYLLLANWPQVRRRRRRRSRARRNSSAPVSPASRCAIVAHRQTT